MKNLVSLLMLAVMLSLTISTLSCASLRTVSPPALEDRTLRLSESAPQLEYQYEKCAKKFLGICTKFEWVKETWDLTDPVVRKMLVDKGFVVRVRGK